MNHDIEMVKAGKMADKVLRSTWSDEEE